MKYKLSHIDSDGDERSMVVDAKDDNELQDILVTDPLGRWYPVHTIELVEDR